MKANFGIPPSQGLKDSSAAQGLAVVDEVNVVWIQLLYLVTKETFSHKDQKHLYRALI